MHQIAVETRRHRDFVDVTAEVARAVADSGLVEGMCLVFSPHTTAAVTVNENADPDVVADLLRAYVDLLGDERQAIYLCEFDGPRHRTLTVQVFGDPRWRSAFERP